MQNILSVSTNLSSKQNVLGILNLACHAHPMEESAVRTFIFLHSVFPAGFTFCFLTKPIVAPLNQELSLTSWNEKDD